MRTRILASVEAGFSLPVPAEAGTYTEMVKPYLGARLLAPNRCEFRVWSPQRDRIEVHIVAPKDRRMAMRKTASGYHEATVDVGAGTRYFFAIDGQDRPDPASRY